MVLCIVHITDDGQWPNAILITRGFFYFFMYCTLFNTASSEIPLCWRMLGSNSGLLGLWYWQAYPMQSWEQFLTVVGNEKQRGSGRGQMLGNVLGWRRSRFIYNWTCSFWLKIIFPFPLSPAKWISDYFDIKGCGANNEVMTHQSSLRQWPCG